MRLMLQRRARVADVVLTLNAGSSSIKFGIYVVEGDALRLDVQGQLDALGSHPHFIAENAEGKVVLEQGSLELGGDGRASAEKLVRHMLERHRVIAVGHRVVHGGPRYHAPVLVDAAILEDLQTFVPLAPLHQPYNLALIANIRKEFPNLPQVACFDTAFHYGHPDLADAFALPYRYHDEGVRRYGFHGLSYQYIMGALPQAAPEIAGKRVIVAHLGNGASLCATSGGKSIDCTIAFSAVGGVPMGTRSGDLDPGVVLYLLQQKGMSASDVENLLYKESGLLGLSGASNDVRDLLASSDPRAAFALELFAYRVAYAIGGLVSTLGGLDGLVFTAGIGEHAAPVRAQILERSAWLGFEIDSQRNADNARRITRDESQVPAYVVPTDEQLVIARETRDAV
jgi:acetate kinase